MSTFATAVVELVVVKLLLGKTSHLAGFLRTKCTVTSAVKAFFQMPNSVAWWFWQPIVVVEHVIVICLSRENFVLFWDLEMEAFRDMTTRRFWWAVRFWSNTITGSEGGRRRGLIAVAGGDITHAIVPNPRGPAQSNNPFPHKDNLGLVLVKPSLEVKVRC